MARTIALELNLPNELFQPSDDSFGGDFLAPTSNWNGSDCALQGADPMLAPSDNDLFGSSGIFGTLGDPPDEAMSSGLGSFPLTNHTNTAWPNGELPTARPTQQRHQTHPAHQNGRVPLKRGRTHQGVFDDERSTKRIKTSPAVTTQQPPHRNGTLTSFPSTTQRPHAAPSFDDLSIATTNGLQALEIPPIPDLSPITPVPLKLQHIDKGYRTLVKWSKNGQAGNYAVTVLGRKKNTIKVHYDDWDDSWDEWIDVELSHGPPLGPYYKYVDLRLPKEMQPAARWKKEKRRQLRKLFRGRTPVPKEAIPKNAKLDCEFIPHRSPTADTAVQKSRATDPPLKGRPASSGQPRARTAGGIFISPSRRHPAAMQRQPLKSSSSIPHQHHMLASRSPMNAAMPSPSHRGRPARTQMVGSQVRSSSVMQAQRQRQRYAASQSPHIGSASPQVMHRAPSPQQLMQSSPHQTQRPRGHALPRQHSGIPSPANHHQASLNKQAQLAMKQRMMNSGQQFPMQLPFPSSMSRGAMPHASSSGQLRSASSGGGQFIRTQRISTADISQGRLNDLNRMAYAKQQQLGLSASLSRSLQRHQMTNNQQQAVGVMRQSTPAFRQTSNGIAMVSRFGQYFCWFPIRV